MNFELLIYEIIFLIFILVGVAFVTLLERSVLGYVQIRRGPNSVGYAGLIQPFSDALKLFGSEVMMFNKINLLVYCLSPVVGLLVLVYILLVFPGLWGSVDYLYGVLYFFCVSSAGVYGLFWCGWSSGSLYSFLGAIRGVAQMISYEVSFIFLILGVVFFVGSFDMILISEYQGIWFGLLCFFLFFLVLVSCLAETNRTPFDFAEGESELVSGFNVEYGGVGFSFIFIAEYGMIIFMSMIVVLFFLGGLEMVVFLSGMLIFVWVWVRGSFPRFRYDSLMYLAWFSYLPISLNYVLFSFGLVLMMVYF